MQTRDPAHIVHTFLAAAREERSTRCLVLSDNSREDRLSIADDLEAILRSDARCSVGAFALRSVEAAKGAGATAESVRLRIIDRLTAERDHTLMALGQSSSAIANAARIEWVQAATRLLGDLQR